MDKKHLTLEEVQSLFSNRVEKYESVQSHSSLENQTTDYLFKIVEFLQNGKIRVFQKMKNENVYTFIELINEQLSNEEVVEIQEITVFLMKLEKELGFNEWGS